MKVCLYKSDASAMRVAHRDLLVLFHAIEHDLYDLPAQPYALIVTVLRVGQVEKSSTARHLDTLIILMTFQRCYYQLEERKKIAQRLYIVKL